MSLRLQEDTLEEFYDNLIDQFGENFIRRALEKKLGRIFRHSNASNFGQQNSTRQLSEIEKETNIKNYINVLLFANNLDNNIIKLGEYFENITTDNEYIVSNNTIIENRMINNQDKKTILDILSKYYAKYYESNNKSEVLLNTTSKSYKIYVDKHILDFSGEICSMLENVFTNILQITNFKLLLKGGAILYLLKSSTSKLNDKKFNFSDFDFVCNNRLKYSQKNKLENYFNSNPIIKIGRYKFEFKTIKHFTDLSASYSNINFKYTLFSINLEYNNEKFRIDISDYDGKPDYHFNNMVLNYTNLVPYINLTENQTVELSNILLDKPTICPLLKHVINQISSSSSNTSNPSRNKNYIIGNLIGVLLRINKALVKGIKTKYIGKYEGDESCVICYTSPNENQSSVSSDNPLFGEIQNQQNQQNIHEIDSESIKYLRGLWIQFPCHNKHKICLACLYDYTKSNLSFNCPCCREICNFDDSINSNSEDEIASMDKIWIRTITNLENNKQIKRNIKAYSLNDLMDCNLNLQSTNIPNNPVFNANGTNLNYSFGINEPENNNSDNDSFVEVSEESESESDL